MKFLYIASAASLAGLVLSMYLTMLPPPQFCEISSFISCDAVLSSPYASFLGFPTALYGVIWFAIASSATFLAVEKKAAVKFMTAWSLLGLAAVAFLVYVEIFVIGSLCILCTATHLLVGVVVASFFYGTRQS